MSTGRQLISVSASLNTLLRNTILTGLDIHSQQFSFNVSLHQFATSIDTIALGFCVLFFFLSCVIEPLGFLPGLLTHDL